MFGMMVLLIALLKITNSCCVWVPSEAAIFNRNEWYNTVADGPEISLGNDSNNLWTIWTCRIMDKDENAPWASWGHNVVVKSSRDIFIAIELRKWNG